MIDSGVNLVELDLLRGGPRLPMNDLSPCDYYALVIRPEERPRGGIWAFHLKDLLPTVPIPLRAPDPDIHLNFKGVLDRVYDGAGYMKYIYDGAPQPPLDPQLREWAEQYLPAGLK